MAFQFLATQKQYSRWVAKKIFWWFCLKLNVSILKQLFAEKLENVQFSGDDADKVTLLFFQEVANDFLPFSVRTLNANLYFIRFNEFGIFFN